MDDLSVDELNRLYSSYFKVEPKASPFLTLKLTAILMAEIGAITCLLLFL